MLVVVPEPIPTPADPALQGFARGLTKVALAPLVGFSAKMLSESENGHAMPTPAAINALSSVLKFPPSFFYRAEIWISQIDGRQLPFSRLVLTTRQQDSVLAAVAMAFEFGASGWTTRFRARTGGLAGPSPTTIRTRPR